MATEQEIEWARSLRELCVAIVEQCAVAVEEIPASADAVIAFKKQAAASIRGLTDLEIPEQGQ